MSQQGVTVSELARSEWKGQMEEHCEGVIDYDERRRGVGWNVEVGLFIWRD